MLLPISVLSALNSKVFGQIVTYSYSYEEVKTRGINILCSEWYRILGINIRTDLTGEVESVTCLLVEVGKRNFREVNMSALLTLQDVANLRSGLVRLIDSLQFFDVVPDYCGILKQELNKADALIDNFPCTKEESNQGAANA